MAPEQFVTGQSSVQSDIFALGLILYELATGRHPFHRPDAPEFQSIRAIQFADPPTIREIAPHLPVELESVILRCLEKQPSARFASAADVREALKTIMTLHAARLRPHARRRHLRSAPRKTASPSTPPKKKNAPPASSPCSPSAFASPAPPPPVNQNTASSSSPSSTSAPPTSPRSTATPSPTPSPPASPA